MPLLVVPRRDRKLNRLVKAAEVFRARRGETLWTAGDPADHLLLVRGGHVRLVEPHPGERHGERTVAVAGPWEMTGEEALLPGARRPRSAVVGETLRYQRLDGLGVASVLRSSTVTFRAFTGAVLEDLGLARHLATGSGGPDASNRLAAVLADLAGRLGEPVGASGRRLTMRPTHRTLGDLCGIHRSTVTTLLNEWLYEGILGGQGRELVVLREDLLKGLARGNGSAGNGAASH